LKRQSSWNGVSDACLVSSLTLQDAKRILAAGEAKAEQIGVPYNLAVVDAGGNLLALVRQDGAWLGSIDIALHKAFTACAFDMSTKELGAMAKPRRSLFGIQNTNDDKIVIFGGRCACEAWRDRYRRRRRERRYCGAGRRGGECGHPGAAR
jgi:uncharacterized protein GlcG (DUF336 family)